MAIPVHSHGEREQVARALPLNRALLGPRRRQAYIACASNVPLSYDACKRSNRGTYLELHRKFQIYQLRKRVHQCLTHHELVIFVTLTQSGRCKLDCTQLNSRDCHTLRSSNGQARRLHRRENGPVPELAGGCDFALLAMLSSEVSRRRQWAIG